MDPLEKAIRDHLREYLAENLTLNELQDWLVGATWNLEASASPAAVDLAYSIELAFAEYFGGYLTPQQLRAELLEIGEYANISAEAPVSA